MTFRSILVPLDGSPLAEQALPLATRIALQSGAKLRLVLVHQLPTRKEDLMSAKTMASLELAGRKADRDYLRRIQDGLRQRGVKLSSEVTLRGAIGPQIARYVREMGVDLVIMGTHGRGGVRRAWLGSVADYLLHHLDVPVLLIRPTEADGSKIFGKGNQILVPLDGSPLAEEALEPAGALARLWNAEVSLLRVVVPVVVSYDAAMVMTSTYEAELTELCRKDAQDYMDSAAERLREQGLKATGVAVVNWNVAETILGAARPDEVGLIVIASHGRSGLRRFVLGSVADKLVRGADTPVLVHRPTGRAAKKRQPRRAAARASR
jgi:nucleotide-binding universal stress UspA family protein